MTLFKLAVFKVLSRSFLILETEPGICEKLRNSQPGFPGCGYLQYFLAKIEKLADYFSAKIKKLTGWIFDKFLIFKKMRV